MFHSNHSIYFNGSHYSKNELFLLDMLSALSNYIVPVNYTYEQADMLIEYAEPGELIKFDNYSTFKFMTDQDKPYASGQNRSFIKLCVHIPKNYLQVSNPTKDWGMFFVVMLVDFVDDNIPEDYQPRLYGPGFDELLDHLNKAGIFMEFFNVVWQATTWHPETFSISTVEQHSQSAVNLM